MGETSGRIAAIVFYGYMLIYYSVGFFTFRQPEAPAMPIVQLCVFLACVVGTLLLPFAKRICVGVFALEGLDR